MGIWLHIWERKEIENYLIVPEAIARVISPAARTPHPRLRDEIEGELEAEANRKMSHAFDSYSQEFLSENRAEGVSRANKMTRELLARKRSRGVKATGVVSGKELFSHLSRWSQDKFGVSFSPASVVRNMRLDEVAEEVRSVVQELEESNRPGR